MDVPQTKYFAHIILKPCEHKNNFACFGISPLQARSSAQFSPTWRNFKYHFKSILYNNFDAFREPLQLHFAACPPTRAVEPFSLKYIDGFSKGLICQCVVAIIDWMASCQDLISILCS